MSSKAIIDYTMEDDSLGVRDALYSAIQDRVMAHIEAKKAEIASNFITQQEEIEEDEYTEFTTEEIETFLESEEFEQLDEIDRNALYHRLQGSIEAKNKAYSLDKAAEFTGGKPRDAGEKQASLNKHVAGIRKAQGTLGKLTSSNPRNSSVSSQAEEYEHMYEGKSFPATRLKEPMDHLKDNNPHDKKSETGLHRSWLNGFKHSQKETERNDNNLKDNPHLDDSHRKAWRNGFVHHDSGGESHSHDSHPYEKKSQDEFDKKWAKYKSTMKNEKVEMEYYANVPESVQVFVPKQSIAEAKDKKPKEEHPWRMDKDRESTGYHEIHSVRPKTALVNGVHKNLGLEHDGIHSHAFNNQHEAEKAAFDLASRGHMCTHHCPMGYAKAVIQPTHGFAL